MKQPDVHYHLHLSRHSNSEDAKGAKQYLENSDIYFPECIGWDDAYQDYYNDISHVGSTDIDAIAAKKGLSNTFATEVLRYLNKSQIEVRFADIPACNDITKKILNLGVHHGMRKLFDSVVDYEKLLEEAHRQFTEQARLDNGREEHIVKQLGNIVQSTATLPAFHQKKRVNVLLTMGTSHKDLFEKLADRYENVTVSGVVEDETLSFIHQYRLQLKREQAPHKELLIRGLCFELLVLMAVNRRLNSRSAEHKIASKASLAQINSLFDAMYSKQPNSVGEALAELIQLDS